MLSRPLALLTFGSLGWAAMCFGTDRYVTPSGLGTNSGTQGSPWSLAKAANSAAAGDVVHIGGGTYTGNASRMNITVSGTAGNPIVFRAKQGEVPIIDMTGVAPAGESSIVRIANQDYVTVQGLTLCNYRTTSNSTTPIGVHITGVCTHVHVLGNTIHHIEQNNTVLGNFNANAHGMLIEGTSSTATDDIIIDGNVLHDLHLGASEALAVNGNVSDFRVTRNTLHHCNNIGIDIIGYEGTAPAAHDRARNGVIAGNVVHDIDSRFNPAYEGNLTTGGGYMAAAGIYVDGGTQCVVESNVVYSCNFGVELAAENGSGFTDFITLRNNLLRHNHGAGLIMGGYDADRGATRDCIIEGNTFYENEALGESGGTLVFQHYVSNNTFRSNLFWLRRTAPQAVNHYAPTAAGALGSGNSFSHNLYFYEGAGGSPAPEFRVRLAGGFQSFNTLAAWQSGSGVGDAGSTFANPQFVNPTPSAGSPPTDYRLSATSPAIDSGAPTFAPAAGERDFFGQSRVQGAQVDRGMAEF